MAIDFHRLLSPETRTRFAATQLEILRLSELPDRWLARALLRIARSLRDAYPIELGDPGALVYEPAFVWHLVPEIARRLGESQLNPNEATRPDIVQLESQAFRECAGSFLENVSFSHLPRLTPLDAPSPTDIISHNVANGNPVAFAIDRLYSPPPPGLDRGDYIARSIREISHARGYPETPYWSYRLQSRLHPVDRQLTRGAIGQSHLSV